MRALATIAIPVGFLFSSACRFELTRFITNAGNLN